MPRCQLRFFAWGKTQIVSDENICDLGQLAVCEEKDDGWTNRVERNLERRDLEQGTRNV